MNSGSENMIISVCITTYNLEKYIDKTLETVINQEFEEEYEILVGDDGSEDNTAGRIQEWVRQYPEKIQLFIMPRDKDKKYNPIYRASQNRIFLAQKAKGKYITFLDGDDFYIDSKKLKKQVEILENPLNSDCAMCTHNINLYFEKNSSEKPVITEEMGEQKICPKQYWGEDKLWIHAEAFVFRKCFLTPQNLENFNLNYFDDNLIVFFFLKYGKIYYIPDRMVNYRQNITEWKEKSILEQHILNAMDLNIERRYNSNMTIASVKRHYSDFKKMFYSRKKLMDDKYKQYVIQAKDRQNKEALLFLEYEALGFKGKCKALLVYFIMTVINWGS